MNHETQTTKRAVPQLAYADSVEAAINRLGEKAPLSEGRRLMIFQRLMRRPPRLLQHAGGKPIHN